MNKTKEKVEKEEGIRFKPDIGDNDYINKVEGNFLERNEQCFYNRNNFIDEENAKQIEIWRYGERKKKIYSCRNRRNY